MQREKASGILLIVGALMLVLVMVAHPTGHQMANAGPDLGRLMHINMVVHGAAIASVPILFLGFLGLSRRLGFTDLTVAALVFHGFAGMAVLGAAIASGFVATGALHEMLHGDAANRGLYNVLLEYTHFFNQGYAGVYVAASSMAILLWSAVMLREKRMGGAVGIAGVIVGSLVLLFFLVGHLQLDVHGFGIVVVAQAAWSTWVGILLLKDRPAQGQPG